MGRNIKSTHSGPGGGATEDYFIYFMNKGELVSLSPTLSIFCILPLIACTINTILLEASINHIGGQNVSVFSNIL